MSNIRKGLLHRAFSIFLFNSDGKLLLQQRAAAKITFPSYWTNTVCSHPLKFECGDESAPQPEMDELDQIGVKRAARRKLEHELGVDPASIELSDFTFMGRAHYEAPSDGVWGEHEIDYILFLQKNVELKPNENEVSDYRYVDADELKQFIATADEKGIKLTPWFQLIGQHGLYTWWQHLDNLTPHQNLDTIIRPAN
jgi:isopentenyl-diphosphate Delta-isomerase